VKKIVFVLSFGITIDRPLRRTLVRSEPYSAMSFLASFGVENEVCLEQEHTPIGE